MMWLARRTALLLLIPLLAACIGEEREQSLGDSIAREINSQVSLVTDPGLNRYVTRIGRRLAEVSDRSGISYRFYIVNSATVNAFALPGGHVYVTRGLIERTETASQLSGVLAHEIGHVAARHGAQQLERHLRTNSIVSLMYRLILGAEPALFEQQALQLGGRLWFASHSRAAEEEADRLAVRYLLASGVDPAGMVALLETLREEEQDRSRFAAEWFSTHPMTASRIQLLEREIETRSGSGKSPTALVEDIASYPAFLRRIEALPPPAYTP
jgi:predicted Zn-dependent protease